MDVRRAGAEDATAIEPLLRPDEVDVATLLANGASLVAEDDGHLAGALLVDAGGTIHALAIADEAEGMGAARVLVEAHIAALQARGVETVRALLAADDAD